MPKKGFRITKQQRALIEAKISNPDGSYKELADQAGAHSAQTAYHQLNIPHVKAEVNRIMDRIDKLRIKKLMVKLVEGLDANEKKYIVVNKELVEKEDPDHSVRHKFLETALELRGALGRDITTTNNYTANIFSSEALDNFCRAYHETRQSRENQGPTEDNNQNHST